ncbi:unnamed protein product [Gadus morhua 'NCC']
MVCEETNCNPRADECTPEPPLASEATVMGRGGGGLMVMGVRDGVEGGWGVVGGEAGGVGREGEGGGGGGGGVWKGGKAKPLVWIFFFLGACFANTHANTQHTTHNTQHVSRVVTRTRLRDRLARS